MDTFILIIDIIGAIAFAYSGVVVAIKHKMDLLGVVLLGCITACGGGVFRDIILGNYPLSIFTLPNYELIAAFITTIVLFILFYMFKHISFFEKKWFLDLTTILDALGLGIFVIMGANVALELNSNWFMVLFSATITAVGGGVLRDLLAMQIPVIFTRRIYALAAVLGSILYYVLYINQINIYVSITLTLIFVLLVRYLSYKFNINLPHVVLPDEDNL